MTATAKIAACACLALLLSAMPASAQSGLTGNWNGTYTFSIQLAACQNTTFTSSGDFSVTMIQVGSFLSGRIDLTNLTLFNGNNCNTTKGEVTLVIFGSVNGSTVTFAVPNDPNGWQFVGSVNGDSLTAQVSDVNGLTGSLNVARTAGAAPAVDVTGGWAGNYSFSDVCPNGASKSYTGALTLALTQSGGRAGGVATMTNVPLYDQNCRTISSLTMSMPVAGVVSGSTFTGVVFEPSGSFEFPISATIAGSAMSGTAAGASATTTSGTFSLTQGSTVAPVSDLSGLYQGTYSELDDERLFCLNIASLAFDGDAFVAIVQTGTAVSGALILEGTLSVISNGFGACAVIDAGEQVLPIWGTLSGNTLSAVVPLPGGVAFQFTVNFSGNDLSGTGIDSFGDLLAFQGTKTATAVPPVITSFSATPASIFSGQSASLSWTTSNATTVSIDNGVGTQSVSGSVTVSPAQTTTYTLTATGPGGTVTAQTTVMVSSGLPRRRPAG